MGSSAATTIRSNGERSLRAHAWLRVPAPLPEPPIPVERVMIGDLQGAPQSKRPRGAAPRNPGQTRYPAPRPPAVELLDGLPMTKAQRIWVDPDQLAAWDEEERSKEPR